MSDIGFVHLTAGLLALIAGFVNLAARKGTRAHRAFGYLFIFSMLQVNLTALSLYRLTGSFNLFHAFAVLSLAVTLAGILPALVRRGRWVPLHALGLQSAYIGLCAATANEILTREVFHWLPAHMRYYWQISLAVSLAVILAGGWLVRRQRLRTLSPLG